jgi:hypothetical protein
MREAQPLATPRAFTACTGITIPFTFSSMLNFFHFRSAMDNTVKQVMLFPLLSSPYMFT